MLVLLHQLLKKKTICFHAASMNVRSLGMKLIDAFDVIKHVRGLVSITFKLHIVVGNVHQNRARHAETSRSGVCCARPHQRICTAKPDWRINRCYWTANVREICRTQQTRGTDAAARHHSDFVMKALNSRQPVGNLSRSVRSDGSIMRCHSRR